MCRFSSQILIKMVELINPNVYQIGEQLILHKYPNAAGTIRKINKTTITVELSSVDQSCDGKMFNVKPDDIAQHWKRSRS
jgi:hypothetical protein